MKTRECYVSNSSSSSYIIAYNDNAEETVVSSNGTEIKFSVNRFIKWLEKESWRYNGGGEETELRTQDVNEIQARAKENHELDKEYYQSIIDFLDRNKGKNFADFDISYDNVEIKSMLLTLIKLGLVEVFADDEHALREDN